MKLRKIEPNEYEYAWENPEKIKYAVVLDRVLDCKHVIAVFDSMYWAQHFKFSMPSSDRMEIFEVIE